MKNNLPALLLLIFLTGCTQTNDNLGPPPYSVTPVKQDASWAIEWWEKRHNEKKEQAQNTEVDLLMLGDSITHYWETDGAAVWEEFYQVRKAFNLGFSADRTEQVLWRLQNGAVDHMSPKLTVLMIGTNNTGHRMDPAEHTAMGIKAILSELRARIPESKILLLGIFPRHSYPNNEMRIRNEEINELIANLKDEKTIYYLNINDVFLDDNYILKEELMPDLLHPNELGYRQWAQAMEPTISLLMR